jgi:hypothetical protein
VVTNVVSAINRLNSSQQLKLKQLPDGYIGAGESRCSVFVFKSMETTVRREGLRDGCPPSGLPALPFAAIRLRRDHSRA